MAKRDIEFLYEIGCLRFIQRTWRQFLNPDFANLAEHSMRVAWTAMILAEQEGVKNTGKIVKMALAHDMAESRTGDVHYLSRQYTKRDEELGIRDMLKDTGLAEEFTALVAEYELRETVEAKIVKDADNLDVDLEIQEQTVQGHKFPEEWAAIRAHLRGRHLYTKSAKKMHEALQTSHPHDWHVKGRNRYNAGDWKPSKTHNK